MVVDVERLPHELQSCSLVALLGDEALEHFAFMNVSAPTLASLPVGAFVSDNAGFSPCSPEAGNKALPYTQFALTAPF